MINRQLAFEYLDELVRIRSRQPITTTPVPHVLAQIHLDRAPRYRDLLVRHMPDNWGAFDNLVLEWGKARAEEGVKQ